MNERPSGSPTRRNRSVIVAVLTGVLAGIGIAAISPEWVAGSFAVLIPITLVSFHRPLTTAYLKVIGDLKANPMIYLLAIQCVLGGMLGITTYYAIGILVVQNGRVELHLISFVDTLVRLALLTYCFKLFPPNLFSMMVRSIQGRTIRSRDEIFAITGRLSEYLVPSDEVYVTSLEEAPADYVEESPASVFFMNVWQARVRLGVKVRQVVRVFHNLEDWNNLEQRLGQYRDLSNYEIGVVIRPPVEPLIDTYVVRGKFGLVGVSATAASRTLMTDGIFVADKGAVNLLCDQFNETLWSQAEPVKTNLRIEENAVTKVRAAVLLLSKFHDNRTWSDFPNKIVGTGHFAENLMELVNLLREASNALEARGDDAGIEHVKNSISELCRRVMLTRLPSQRQVGSAFEAMQACQPITTTITAVSALENEEYWSSSLGRKQMELEEHLVRSGVSVFRVFLVSSRGRLSSAAKSVLKRQQDYAGSDRVRAANRSDVEAELKNAPPLDFAVVDRSKGVVDDGQSVTVFTDSVTLNSFSELFRVIYDIAGSRGLSGSLEERQMEMTVVRKTVVSVDLVGYSTLARNLEQNIDAKVVSQLNDQIRFFIRKGLEAASTNPEDSLLADTGDGALVMFSSSGDAHSFAVGLYAAVDEYNSSRTEATAKRRFRVGAAAGMISIKEQAGNQREAAGIVIANAVRIQTAADPGEFVVDVSAFEELDLEKRTGYGPEETVAGKRDETFTVHRCVMAFEPEREGSIAQRIGVRVIGSADRHTLLRELESIFPEARLDTLMFLIGMPVDQRPDRSLTHAERRAAVLRWAESPVGCGLEQLMEEVSLLSAATV